MPIVLDDRTLGVAIVADGHQSWIEGLFGWAITTEYRYVQDAVIAVRERNGDEDPVAYTSAPDCRLIMAQHAVDRVIQHFRGALGEALKVKRDDLVAMLVADPPPARDPLRTS